MGARAAGWDNGAVSQPTEQRPPQVTLAAGMVMFSSVLVLLTACERVSALGSLETQDGDPGRPRRAAVLLLGLDVDGAIQILLRLVHGRRGLRVRHRDPGLVRPQARPLRAPGLTIFAVPVFVTGLPAGGLAGSFVAAGCGDALDAARPRVVRHRHGGRPPPAPEQARTAAEGDARGVTPWRRRPRPPVRRRAGAAAGEPVGARRRPQRPSAGPPSAAQPPTASTSPPRAVAAHRRAGRQRQPAARPAAGDGRGLRASRSSPPAACSALSLLWLAIAGFSPDFLAACWSSSSPRSSTTA